MNVSKEQLSHEFTQIIQKGQYDAADKLLTTLRNSVDVNEYLTEELCFSAAFLYHAIGKRDTEFLYIKAGFTLNHRSPELFMALADYYSVVNAQQCLICLYQALFYAKMQGKNDTAERVKVLIAALSNKGIEVPKTSFVILSFNTLGYIRQCLDSIKETVPLDRCQIIVVDNASTDGSVKYLRSLDWITLVENKDNRGFPGGCNDGIAVSDSNNDIYLLNSDTILPLNAFFWLKMGLYENGNIGSTGSITNYAANNQAVKNDDWKTPDDVINYGIQTNVPMDSPYEYRMFLIGFSLLLKRSVLDEVGALDERFNPGNSEDIDIGLRILKSGRLNVLCRNSFVFHYGSRSFAELQKMGQDYGNLLKINSQKLKDKMGYDPSAFLCTNLGHLSYIKGEKFSELHILELGCDMGADAALLKTVFPNSTFFGVSCHEDRGAYAKAYGHIIIGDINKIDLKSLLPKDYFDFVIIGDELDCTGWDIDYDQLHKEVIDILKSDGQVVGREFPVIINNNENPEKKHMVAFQVPTYMHPEAVEEVLSQRLELFQRLGIDMYYYDSSTDDRTKRVVEKYQKTVNRGLYYYHIPSDLQVERKFIMILAGYGLHGDYEYTWFCKDRELWYEQDIEWMLDVLKQNSPDLLVMIPSGYNPQAGKQLVPQISPEELYASYTNALTSSDASLYRRSSMLKDLKIPDKDYTAEDHIMNFPHFKVMMEALDRLQGPRINVLVGVDWNEIPIASVWNNDKIYQTWFDDWIDLNNNLPKRYRPYMKQAIGILWNHVATFGGYRRLTQLNANGVLTEVKFTPYKKEWDTYSTRPSEELYRVMHHELDALYGIDTGNQLINQMINIHYALRNGKLKVSEVNWNTAKNVAIEVIKQMKTSASDQYFNDWINDYKIGIVRDLFDQIMEKEDDTEKVCRYIKDIVVTMI